MMYSLNFYTEADLLTVALGGKIDSENAGQIDAELEKILAENPHGSIHIDMDELIYISSAGLRVILKILKNGEKLSLVNVSSEVYDILGITGFTDMLPVERAFRRLSVDGCAVIGRGATGTVYRYDDELIVKVYREDYSLDDITRERLLARSAFIFGIPTAIPFDVVRVGDRYGSVFELLRARSFAELIIDEPSSLDRYIDMSVELLKKIHSTTVTDKDFPSAKPKALRYASHMKDILSSDKAEKLMRMAEALPDSMTLIHGDLHIKNMMMQNGELLLIDMETLSHGHPVLELANIYSAYLGYSETDHGNAMDFFGIPYETSVEIWEKTLSRYLGSEDKAAIAQTEDKIRLMSYISLYETFDGTPGEEQRLAVYLDHIEKLLDSVDSFEF